MVALADVVAGEAKNIAHAQSGRAQNVALQRDAVTVATGKLRDRSDPLATRMAAAAALDMWQLAPAPSVMLMASTRSRKREARAISTAGSEESGGETSTVTTKRPDLHACSKLKVSRAGAACGRIGGRGRMRAVDHPQP